MSIVDNVKIIKKIHVKDIAMVQVGKFVYTYGKDAYISKRLIKGRIKINLTYNYCI